MGTTETQMAGLRKGNAGSNGGVRIGVDTGGTFTDLVLVRDGEVTVVKVPSTPPNFEAGVIAAIEGSGVDPARITQFAHGTTATTNALITKTGAPTGLVTTKGFRDVLELRRHDRGDLYDIMWDPPPPLVPRHLRLEVTQRTDYLGGELIDLDEGEARRVARELKQAGVKAVAVTFLHSYANPAAEERMREILLEEIPETYISISSQLLRESDEFERSATTTANAYLGPVLRRYLDRLNREVVQSGFAGTVYVMHSGGGLLSAKEIGNVPVRTLTSGPAAGAIAAAEIARATGTQRLISLDMGGTSADIATVRDGEVELTTEYEAEFGLPIRFPAIDLITIGAGGGSLVTLDAAGVPKVGPQSAGALPGPACYQRGGVEPTVTDANLILGRLAADSPLASGLTLDLDLATKAMRPIAESLDVSVEEAAAGVIRIANSNMAKAVRVMTVERGLDPREFTLMGFGGAGPLHAFELADELLMTGVLVPAHPGVTSALGLLSGDAVHDVGESYVRGESEIEMEELEEVFGRVAERALKALLRDGFSPEDVVLHRFIDVRYAGQVRSLTLPLNEQSWLELQNRFFVEYERRYQYVTRDLPLEIAALRVKAVAGLPRPELRHTEPIAPAVAEPEASRPVWFGESFVETGIFARSGLLPGHSLEGPAIINDLDATTVVPPGWKVQVHELEHLFAERKEPNHG